MGISRKVVRKLAKGKAKLLVQETNSSGCVQSGKLPRSRRSHKNHADRIAYCAVSKSTDVFLIAAKNVKPPTGNTIESSAGDDLSISLYPSLENILPRQLRLPPSRFSGSSTSVKSKRPQPLRINESFSTTLTAPALKRFRVKIACMNVYPSDLPQPTSYL